MRPVLCTVCRSLLALPVLLTRRRAILMLRSVLDNLWPGRRPKIIMMALVGSECRWLALTDVIAILPGSTLVSCAVGTTAMLFRSRCLCAVLNAVGGKGT